jgi:hypothetical protein
MCVKKKSQATLKDKTHPATNEVRPEHQKTHQTALSISSSTPYRQRHVL